MKLYIVVRADLTPGARAAQSCHATSAFVAAHPEQSAQWRESSNNLVCLEIANEPLLLAMAQRAGEHGIPHTLFREPDLGDEATALALMSPQARRLTSSLPLALRDAVDHARESSGRLPSREPPGRPAPSIESPAAA